MFDKPQHFEDDSEMPAESFERYRFKTPLGNKVELYRFEGISGSVYELCVSESPSGKRKQNQELQLLFHLCGRPRQYVSVEEIELTIRVMGVSGGAVDQVVTKLRKALEPEGHEIISRDTKGICLNADPHRDGDLGGIRTHQRWNQNVFQNFVDNAVQTKAELRLSTYGFGMRLQDILGGDQEPKNAAIKILMMDPDHNELMEGHFGLREHPPAATCIVNLASEIKWISNRLAKRPSYELRLSKYVPSGFLAQTEKGAILGLFLAHESYHDGPMFEIDRETRLWKTLNMEWEKRWITAYKTETSGPDYSPPTIST